VPCFDVSKRRGTYIRKHSTRGSYPLRIAMNDHTSRKRLEAAACTCSPALPSPNTDTARQDFERGHQPA